MPIKSKQNRRGTSRQYSYYYDSDYPVDWSLYRTLPAADGPGIDYVLTLNAATDNADTVYTLDMTYLDAEGQGQNKTFTSKGKQETVQKVVNKKPVTAVKLNPKDGEAPMYFVVVNDTTLRLVNDSLQEAVSNLNYDIIKVK